MRFRKTINLPNSVVTGATEIINERAYLPIAFQRALYSLSAVNKRIIALMPRDDLSRTALAVLETLVRQTCFSSNDLWFFKNVEERYRVEQAGLNRTKLCKEQYIIP